jgi:hypothetical protein
MQALLPLCSLNVTLHAAGAVIAQPQCHITPRKLPTIAQSCELLAVSTMTESLGDKKVQAPLPLRSLNVMLHAAGAVSVVPTISQSCELLAVSTMTESLGDENVPKIET